jgi:hypothetical protein
MAATTKLFSKYESDKFMYIIDKVTYTNLNHKDPMLYNILTDILLEMSDNVMNFGSDEQKKMMQDWASDCGKKWLNGAWIEAEEDDEEDDDDDWKCYDCEYIHHYEDKCPIGDKCEKYEKGIEEDIENRCDCCANLWNEDAPSDEICHCEHQNHLLRDCRYKDCAKLEKEIEEDMKNRCDCCANLWNEDAPSDEICHCWHDNHLLRDCRYKDCAKLELKMMNEDEEGWCDAECEEEEGCIKCNYFACCSEEQLDECLKNAEKKKLYDVCPTIPPEPVNIVVHCDCDWMPNPLGGEWIRDGEPNLDCVLCFPINN